MAKAKPFIADEYLDNPETIAAYLNDAFETGDDDFIAKAIGTVARARGMTDIAREAGLDRVNLYRALSGDGRPEFATVMKVLSVLHMRLVAKPAPEPAEAA